MNRKITNYSGIIIVLQITLIIIISFSLGYSAAATTYSAKDITIKIAEPIIAQIEETIPETKSIEVTESTEQEEPPETTSAMTYTESDYTPVESEYYEASMVYNHFINLGYSHGAISGILGNMMAECGGQTLALQPNAYDQSGTYYGLCQWGPYYPDIQGRSLEDQIMFLEKTIANEFYSYGHIFGCTFEEFISLDDPAKAALYFAQIYERCNSVSYDQRQYNAQIAYEYFL